MLSSKAFGNMSTRLAWATIFAVALSSVFNVYALRIVRPPPLLFNPALEATQGQILSQSPTDAISSGRWHVNES